MTKFEELREKILPVLQPYGAKRVALFGSVVRGEETPESDIDILVTFGKPIGLFKWVELEEELSKRLGRKADLVSARALKPRIRPHVEAEMVVIYEKTRRPRALARYSRRDQTHRVLSARER
jgi:predicted nucleotidyltransferase